MLVVVALVGAVCGCTSLATGPEWTHASINILQVDVIGMPTPEHVKKATTAKKSP